MKIGTKFYQKLMPQFTQKQISNWLSYIDGTERLTRMQTDYENVSEVFNRIPDDKISQITGQFKIEVANISKELNQLISDSKKGEEQT